MPQCSLQPPAPRVRPLLRPVVVVGVVAIVLLTGCSSSGAGRGRSAPPALGTSASHHAGNPSSYKVGSGDVNGKALPILAYLNYNTTAEEQSANIVIARCMASFGYTSNVPQMQVTQLPANLMYRRYGVTSLAVAERWGYHLEAGSPLRGSAPSSLQPRMSKAEMLVYSGTDHGVLQPPASSGAVAEPAPAPIRGTAIPSGGCSGMASREVYGAKLAGQADPYALPQAINLNGFEESQTSPTVVAAFQRWSRCMAKRGFDYATPFEAGNAFDIQTPNPSSQEVATATADVECKSQAHLVTTWFKEESRLEEASIQKNIVALDVLRAQEVAAETVAVHLASGSPSHIR